MVIIPWVTLLGASDSVTQWVDAYGRWVALIMIVVFGGLKNIVNAFPVVEALRNKFQAETVWLTSPAYAALAGASAADAILEMEPREIIPWDWIHSEGFTHVFFADPEGNGWVSCKAPS